MGISPQNLQVIRASLPAVAGAIGDVTPLFYRSMFAAHPELERDLFNRGNQSQGEQQKALAGAIAAYATIRTGTDPERAQSIISRIAHKHASLGITADQYAIVHKHLFGAIAEVLGDALTDDVAAAWDELYWDMGQCLVTEEDRLYAEAGVEPGDVWRELKVVRRVQQSAETVTFALAAGDGAALPQHRPGQYVSVQVQLPDGAQQIRQYSLVGAPRAPHWEISVKALPAVALADGVGTPEGEVSNHLYRNVFEGDTLRVSMPFGDLVLDDGDSPVMLVSAGIGCTPMIGMLHHLADTGSTRPVSVLHADRSPSHHAHRAEITELVGRIPSAKLHRWYEDLGARPAAPTVASGRADVSGIGIDQGTTVYMCGPMPFMRSMRRSLIARDVPADSIHCEVFGPEAWDDADRGTALASTAS
ncbi:globin domain-containing protein [Tomitella fengzijianii]|uniref:nitric oxide dioxygenase n=1 Tax=Tomitella fengzijianii TaxID=2597660 RepID=A0A516X3W9_9ACTN|nr:globin domain-containing protein [Tomitella fengzijianii]QDQ97775.1 hemin transporter [Tomitella fengzijianii]